jgi:histidinol dehydrogenase
VIRRLDLRSAGLAAAPVPTVVPRAGADVDDVVETVRHVCDGVRDRGIEAIVEASRRYDGVDQTDLAVPRDVIDAALDQLDPDIRRGLEESIGRLRRTCEAELERDVVTEVVPGGTVRRRIVPMGRVGLYVPGGLAPLVSSVVMNAVPAQVAGVPSIAVTSSPQREHGGWPHPTILAACALLGLDEVYAVGGAQAIAMFAYGAGPCRPVDLVAGPGNSYVVAAKRLLKGRIGIDSEAGPTEIAILADGGADPAGVAADLISEAEHAETSASVLVTDSESLVERVTVELDRQVAATKHRGRITAALTGQQSAIVLVDDMQQGLAVVDAYAPEHLEIHTANAGDLAMRVRNAGAIFVGPWAPTPLGDYCAGSNHVLPTGACACHSSGLTVRSFTKTVQVISWSEAALRASRDAVVALAEAEDLPAHGAALRIRVDDGTS